MFPKRIEEVAFNAWPALQHILLDGWILRFARGYTRRANSVNALYPSSLPLDEKIATCEQIYHAWGLPTVFRLTPFSMPATLDSVLAQRGYAYCAPTLVLAHHLPTQTAFQTLATHSIQQLRLDEWFLHLCQLNHTTPEQHSNHYALLQAIPAQRVCLALKKDGNVVFCGLLVLEQGFAGLFDLITAAAYRHQGYGTQGVASMLGWAYAHGAVHAYLQVELHNRVAQQVYHKVGFRTLYHYWYRVPNMS